MTTTTPSQRSSQRSSRLTSTRKSKTHSTTIPARKLFISQIHSSNTSNIWLQGVVVRTGDDGVLYLDDASGVVRVYRKNSEDRRKGIEVGDYVMVVGKVVGNGAGKGLMTEKVDAHTCHRIDEGDGGWYECLWNTEVVDLYLYQAAVK